jgi:hypothetical protein
MREINAYTVYVRNRQLKKPRGRWKHRWEDNIKKDIKRISCEGWYWIEMIHEHSNETSASLKA